MPSYIFKPPGRANWHVRRRVPLELVGHLSRNEIRQSLRTADNSEAKCTAPYALAAIEATFDKARRELATAKRGPPLERFAALTDAEIHRIVAAYFIREESSWENSRIAAEESEQKTAEFVEYFQDHLKDVFSDHSAGHGIDFVRLASDTLKEEGIALPDDSPGLLKLKNLLNSAYAEVLRRQIKLMERSWGSRNPGPPADELFKDRPIPRHAVQRNLPTVPTAAYAQAVQELRGNAPYSPALSTRQPPKRELLTNQPPTEISPSSTNPRRKSKSRFEKAFDM